METIVENLKYCVNRVNELSKLDIDAMKQENSISTSDELSENFQQFGTNNSTDYLLKLIFNNTVVLENVFSNPAITQFLYDSFELLLKNPKIVRRLTATFKMYLDKYLDELKSNPSDLLRSELNLKFLTSINLDKTMFAKLITALFNEIDLNVVDKEQLKSSEFLGEIRFNLVSNLLLKHQTNLFEMDINLFDELNTLEERHLTSLEVFGKTIRYILICLTTFDVETILQPEKIEKMGTFLIISYKYKPILFELQLRLLVKAKSSKLPKYLRKFISKFPELVEIVDRCLKEDNDEVMVENGGSTNVAKNNSQIDPDAILGSLGHLVENYEYTLSKRDTRILTEIYRKDSSLNCLIFKLIDSDSDKSGILNKQAKIADFISLKLDETKLADSVLSFPFNRKLENIAQEYLDDSLNSKIYDPIYLLPNIYNLLDYGN